MRILFFIFSVFLNFSILFSKDYTSKLVLHLTNGDSTYYAHFINDSGVVIYDSSYDSIDSFTIKIKEPTSVVYIIKNDTVGYISFYLEPGRIELITGANYPRTKQFINSPLNDELFKQRKEEDSILAMVYTKEIVDKVLKNSMLSHIRDSLKSEYNKHMLEYDRISYNKGLKNTHSFLTLKSLAFWLTEYLRYGDKYQFTRQELQKLYRKIDKSMRHYPTYILCKKMLKQRPKPVPEINAPIFKDQ